MKILKTILVAVNFFAANVIYSQDTPAFIRDSLDIYVNRSLEMWKVPGVAVAVVKDGKVIWMKGSGRRELNKNEPVDENTLFIDWLEYKTVHRYVTRLARVRRKVFT